jgi:dolichyl-phosphate-mannose--protein O-mannosyl transferase
MHFSIIKIPDKTVFDEVHYVTDARGVISGSETVRGEHPPLGKLFVIAGMLIFGDNIECYQHYSFLSHLS